MPQPISGPERFTKKSVANDQHTLIEFNSVYIQNAQCVDALFHPEIELLCQFPGLEQELFYSFHFIFILVNEIEINSCNSLVHESLT